MRLIAITALAGLMLSGCGNMPENVGVSNERVAIVGVKRPKRFRIQVKVLKTGEIHDVYVSKRCGSWRNAKWGMVFDMPFTQYRNAKGERWAEPSGSFLREKFC